MFLIPSQLMTYIPKELIIIRDEVFSHKHALGF